MLSARLRILTVELDGDSNVASHPAGLEQLMIRLQPLRFLAHMTLDLPGLDRIQLRAQVTAPDASHLSLQVQAWSSQSAFWHSMTLRLWARRGSLQLPCWRSLLVATCKTMCCSFPCVQALAELDLPSMEQLDLRIELRPNSQIAIDWLAEVRPWHLRMSVIDNTLLHGGLPKFLLEDVITGQRADLAHSPAFALQMPSCLTLLCTHACWKLLAADSTATSGNGACTQDVMCTICCACVCLMPCGLC